MPDERALPPMEDPAAEAESMAAEGEAHAAMNACADALALHIEAAANELQSLRDAIALDAAADAADDAYDAADEAGDAAEAAPRSASSLTVERRTGSTVELRSATGAVRCIAVPEARSMIAPITVDETTEADQSAPVFRGHAAVFDRESEDLGGFREVIARGAFRKALDANQDTVALFNHDPNYVLGRTTNNTLDLREDPRGLHAYFQAPDTQYARDLREVVRRGDVNQMSFAFTVAKDDWQERSDGTILRRVLEVNRLHDVSLVTSPAYTQTDAQSVRSEDFTDHSEPTLEPLEVSEAGADESAHEAREVSLSELQAGAKRRLTLAHAKTIQQKG